MKKYKLRENFSIETKDGVAVGPCELELTEAQAEGNKHKLEACEFHEPDGTYTATEEIKKEKPVQEKKAKGKDD